jgi:hypothetical protein
VSRSISLFSFIAFYGKNGTPGVIFLHFVAPPNADSLDIMEHEHNSFYFTLIWRFRQINKLGLCPSWNGGMSKIRLWRAGIVEKWVLGCCNTGLMVRRRRNDKIYNG